MKKPQRINAQASCSTKFLRGDITVLRDATRTYQILEKKLKHCSWWVCDHKRGFHGSSRSISIHCRREMEEKRIVLSSFSWERVLHMQVMQRKHKQWRS